MNENHSLNGQSKEKLENVTKKIANMSIAVQKMREDLDMQGTNPNPNPDPIPNPNPDPNPIPNPIREKECEHGLIGTSCGMCNSTGKLLRCHPKGKYILIYYYVQTCLCV